MSNPAVVQRSDTRQPSISFVRSRAPSRTQLRHAHAVRRLLSESGGTDLILDEYHIALQEDKGRNENPKAESSAQVIREESKRTKDCDPTTNNTKVAKIEPEPYLRKSLDSVGIEIMADSANMETLMDHRDYLRASFVTPESMLHCIKYSENFYHVWAAVTLALDEVRGRRSDLEEVVKVATTRFIVEMGSALNDCLQSGLPHYTFLDPRKIHTAEGRSEMVEQALSIAKGFEKKGVARDRIFITIPATEGGLEVARALKDQYSIKTNMAFVSGLTQASACIEAGADAITMSVGPNLQYHECRRGVFCHMLKPHPGFENIKAVACYLKHNGLKTKLIATSLRNLDEVQQLSAVSSVCFADWQMHNVKWYRSRIARLPGPKSTAVLRAIQAPYPPLHTKGDFKYLTIMSSETRRETLAILDPGLRTWQVSMTRIADAVRNEIKRRIDIATIPLSREPTLTDEEAIEYYEETKAVPGRSLASSKTRRDPSIAVVFPSLGCEKDVGTPVPQSPLLRDMDDFESSGSSEEDEMEAIIF